MLKWVFIVSFLAAPMGMASSEYINSNLVETAIQNALGEITAGVGAKSNSCLLCHSSSSGGPGNINSGFGEDFRNTAIALNLPNNGAQLDLAQLESIFSDRDFLDEDSDLDGESNEAEFLANEDPADNSGDTDSGGGSGGGCGSISMGPSRGNPTTLFLLLLPLLLIWGLRAHKPQRT